jgi:hypothetical protein
MKKTPLLILISFLTTTIFCQPVPDKNIYLKLSGGRVSFGSGDFLGYSFSFEAARNIVKKPSFGLDKLLIGGELIFETGVKNPVIQNPSIDDLLAKTFNHLSTTLLWTKASYYPFKKIIRGFNIQVGPTLGHSYRSTEFRRSRSTDAIGQTTRVSTLSFNNNLIYGYRISTGLEFDISKKIITGFRLDFSNNNEAEINTFAAIKLGIKL